MHVRHAPACMIPNQLEPGASRTQLVGGRNMVISSVRLLRAVVVGAVVALALAACGGASQAPSGGGSAGASPSGGAGQAGGKITILVTGEQFDQIDPQRAYTGEDPA